MSYRPICDTWILARSKTKYYGAYPAGFLHRAMALLGVGRDAYVLHVCAGRVRDYPYRGLGPNHKTLDLNPKVKPTWLRDAREPFPLVCLDGDHPAGCTQGISTKAYARGGWLLHRQWDAILIDRPYTDADADQYIAEGLGEKTHVYPAGLDSGALVLPPANLLIKHAIAVLPIGGRVGILDYLWPQPPKNATEVAVVGVGTGRNSRARWFTVFERME